MTQPNCPILQPHCGLEKGDPICPKCGLDARVRYVSETDAKLAMSQAKATYWESHARTLESATNQHRLQEQLSLATIFASPVHATNGRAFQDTDFVPKMVVIPEGGFLMGSAQNIVNPATHEGPQHYVKISYPFAFSEHMVSVKEWDRCVADGGVEFRPAYCNSGWIAGVSWDDAQNYIGWLNRKLQLSATDPGRYRLPSEAEWEYVCRAGSQNPPLAAHSAHSPNVWGIYEFNKSGMEWVQDRYANSYQGLPTDGSAWEKRGWLEKEHRVTRGGTTGPFLDVTGRVAVSPTSRKHNTGFRVARTLRTS